MQSRGTLICFISTILILIIFNNNLSHFKKVLLILVLISIPSSIAELISNYKFNYNLHNFYNKCILKIDNNYREDRICDTTNYTYSLNYEFVENYFKKKEETSNNNQNINNNNNNLSSNSEINSNSEIKNVNKYPGNEARLFKPHSHPTAGYTSGRIDIWKRIFKLYDFKKFFGLGNSR